MERMLEDKMSKVYAEGYSEHTLPPPGMLISMTLFAGRLYTEPDGNRLAAEVVPLRIWSRTGTLGGLKGAPFISN